MTEKKIGRLSTGRGTGTLYKSGGKWYGRITVNGRRITVPTGCTVREDALRFMDAYTLPLRAEGNKAKLEHIASEIRLIDGDIDEARRRAADYQITDIMHRVTASRPMSKSTRTDYRAALGALCRFMHDGHPCIVRMSEITKDIAREFRDYLAGRVMPGTANLYMGKIKAAWTVLTPTAQNPWTGVKVPGRSTPCKDLTEDEFTAVMRSAREKGGDMAYLFELAALTAMRLSDCCLLTWDMVDLSRRIITFTPRKLNRTGKTVQIPMSRAVLDLLTARARPERRRGFVSPKLASAWGCNFAQLRARRVFSAAGIPPRSGKSFHSLRVHAITRMLDAGIPLATVQAIAGHASPEMTQHYYRMDIDRAREAIDRLSASNGHKEKTEKPAKGGGDLLSILGALTPEQRAALKSLL